MSGALGCGEMDPTELTRASRERSLRDEFVSRRSTGASGESGARRRDHRTDGARRSAADGVLPPPEFTGRGCWAGDGRCPSLTDGQLGVLRDDVAAVDDE